MESDTNGQRYVTWFLMQEGSNAADIHRRLCNVVGDHAPSRRTVYNWIEAFRDGKNNTNDAERSGRPRTSNTPENVSAIQEYVSANPRSTVRQLADGLDIPSKSVHRILTEELGLNKISCRWVPRFLNANQKQQRVDISTTLLQRYREEGDDFLSMIVTGDESWFFFYDPETKAQSMEWHPVGSPPPLKARSEHSVEKRMACVFFDRQGILLIKWVPRGATVNSDFYIRVLTELRQAIKEKRRGKLTRGVLLLQDNARPHTSRQTQAAIRDMGFTVLPHPPYSPDLSPCDYWLFAEMKRPLKGRRFGSVEALASSVWQWSNKQSEEWFADGLNKLPARWERCIERGGEWIEAATNDDE